MIPGHLKNPSKKPLAISFHGLTGIGKSYITRITAENLFKLGMKSKYYHEWRGTKEFDDSHSKYHYRHQALLD
ncbi:TOR1A [Bugula neritina]|uniref:TOR1A n=1 Tax=Bugula neritina TaxID=10212 RepID=A0A7J7K185_BUGNE|nr:TOR1A [Bugula neritina]